MLTSNYQGGQEDGNDGLDSNYRCDFWPDVPDDSADFHEKAAEKQLLQIIKWLIE